MKLYMHVAEIAVLKLGVFTSDSIVFAAMISIMYNSFAVMKFEISNVACDV